MKKGFSIIELLAAIIILGIISTIAMVVYDNVVHNMKIKAYNTQKESFITSAEYWLKDKKGTKDYPESYPYKLTLNQLLIGEYIEKNICNQEEKLIIDYNESYIEIKEKGKKFEYNLIIKNTNEECK